LQRQQGTGRVAAVWIVSAKYLFLAPIVAAARVAVGLHHPIDVVASMAIAVVVTSAVFLVFRRVARDEAA
jgi:membrane-associated phospholipid phosphatase